MMRALMTGICFMMIMIGCGAPPAEPMMIDKYGNVTLTLNGLPSDDNTLVHTGNVSISGAGIQGSYQTSIARDSLEEGGYLTVVLPLGEKTIEVEMIFSRDGMEYRFSGTQTVQVQEGNNQFEIVLRRDGAADAEIEAKLEEKISVTIIEDRTGYGVVAAFIEFRTEDKLVETGVTDERGQVFLDLPVQGASDDAYGYRIYRNGYQEVSGTIKVLMGLVIVDGQESPVMHLGKKLTPDGSVGPGELRKYKNSANGQIPDGDTDGIESLVQISESYEFADCSVWIDITHPKPCDLWVELEHEGTSVVLWDDSMCGSLQLPWTFNLPDFVEKTDSSGDWILHVYDQDDDQEDGQEGWLNGWELQLFAKS